MPLTVWSYGRGSELGQSEQVPKTPNCLFFGFIWAAADMKTACPWSPVESEFELSRSGPSAFQTLKLGLTCVNLLRQRPKPEAAVSMLETYGGAAACLCGKCNKNDF